MNICPTVEKAALAWTRQHTLEAGLNLYKGMERPAASEQSQEFSPRRTPCAIFVCRAARHTPGRDGNWMAQLDVRVRSNAKDTPAETHHTRAESIFELFQTTTIAADLTAAIADFTAFHCVAIDEGYDLSGDNWESFMTFEIHCCNRRIPEE